MVNVLAKENFKVGGKDVETNLVESSAHKYGNGTAVVIFWDNGYIDQIDTRYEKGLNAETFSDWMLRELRARTRPDIEVRKA